MNLTELKVARIRHGVKAKVIADALGKTVDSYMKREYGSVGITLSDMVALTKVMDLSLSEFITIFFSGDLPFLQDEREDYDFRQFVYPLVEARKRAGVTEEEAAQKLQLPVSAYRQRERGRVLVSPVECAILSKMYGLTLNEFNDVFFRSCLPFRKADLLDLTHIIPQKAGGINAEKRDEMCG